MCTVNVITVVCLVYHCIVVNVSVHVLNDLPMPLGHGGRVHSVLPARLLLPFSQLSGSNTALHILAHLKWLWHFELWALKQCGGFRVITGMIVEWTCFCVCERECTFLYAGAVLIKKMFSLNHLIFFPTHISSYCYTWDCMLRLKYLFSLFGAQTHTHTHIQTVWYVATCRTCNVS